MKTTDVPFLRGEAMPEPKPAAKPQPKPAPAPESESTSGLTPAGEASNPAVQQLLAELATARANGQADDAADIVAYLGELGYSA
jgi:hypothetical protein